ncbi:MAG: YcxB family protein, partial [Oscillospiraceae bacterium]|nr:YcxB family protein [Oscillospiraceae bacterium]
AEMQHSAETVKRFTHLQYDTFEWWRKLLLFILSALLILFGVFFGSSSGFSILTVFCIFAGSILFTNLNTRANMVADQVIEAMQETYPVLQYSFSETGFTDGKDRPTVSYAKLFRLISDEEYLYLFASKASGYMIRKKSITGEGGAQGLMDLISQKSGLSWQNPVSFLTFSIKDLYSLIRRR